MTSRMRVLAIGLTVALLLLVPYTRHILLFQFMHGLGPSNYVYMMYYMPTIPKVEREVPRSVNEALAIANQETFRARSAQPYLQMIDRYPGEPALYANMLRYAAKFGESLKVSRPEISRGADAGAGRSEVDWKPVPDSPELRDIERVIGMGKKLEPDNSYFDLFEAALRFNQGRDSEALAAIHRAAGKKDFDGHHVEETMALLEVRHNRIPVPLDWLNPMGRFLVRQGMLFPDLACFSQTWRLAAWHIEEDRKRGKQGEALRRMVDLIRVGGVMRDQHRWAGISFHGLAAQKEAVGGAYRGLLGVAPGSTDRGTRGRNRKSWALAGLEEIESAVRGGLSPAEWRMVRHELTRSEEFTACVENWKWRVPLLRPHMWTSWLLTATGHFLLQSMVLSIFAFAAWLWLRGWGRETLTTVGPSRLSIWLLAVLPPVMAGVLATALSVICPFEASPAAVSSFLRRASPWLVIGLVFAIAGVRTRVVPGIGRLSTFLGRLQRGSVLAIQASLVLYVLAVIVWLPVTAWANAATDYAMTNQVRTIWECRR